MTSRTVFRRYKSRLKMLMSETCVSAMNETMSTGTFDMKPTEESQKQEVESIKERAGTVARS